MSNVPPHVSDQDKQRSDELETRKDIAFFIGAVFFFLPFVGSFFVTFSHPYGMVWLGSMCIGVLCFVFAMICDNIAFKLRNGFYKD